MFNPLSTIIKVSSEQELTEKEQQFLCFFNQVQKRKEMVQKYQRRLFKAIAAIFVLFFLLFITALI